VSKEISVCEVGVFAIRKRQEWNLEGGEEEK
jgi:hypothetical protein